MYRLPLVLALILSFMLPAFGGVAVGVAAEPCPMQAAPAGPSPVAMASPCCEDMQASQAGSSKSPCKSGYECKVGGLLQSVSGKFCAPVPAHPATPLAQSRVKREPADLWRPPRVV